MRLQGVLTLILLAIGIHAGCCQSIYRDSLETALRNSRTAADRVSTLCAIARWHQSADFRKAVSFANQAISAGQAVGGEANAMALTIRASVYWHNGEYDSSIVLNQRSLAVRSSLHNVGGVAENRHAIGMNHYYMANYDSAIVQLNLALEGFNRVEDVRNAASSTNMIGLVYHQMGNYPEVIRNLQEVARLRDRVTGYKGRTYNLGPVSPYFRSSDYFDQELSIQQKALGDLLKTHDQEKIFLTYLNIADTYKELGQFTDALATHKKAARYGRTFGWTPMLTYMGNAYRSANMIDSALIVHKAAMKEILESNSRLDALELFINLGKDYDAAGDPGNALTYYRKSLELTTRMKNKLDIVLNSNRVARMLMKLRRYDEARSYAGSALGYARRIKAKTYLRDSYILNADIEEELGNFESAHFLDRQARLLSDSLTAGEAEVQFARLQAQFQLDKKNEDIKILTQDKQLQEAAIRNRDNLIVGSVSILTLSIMLGISAYLRYRQKNRANAVLAGQKHQIEILLAEIHHRVKNNLQVISSLLSIQSNQLKDENARLAVLEGQSRVHAMGLIHENIYKAENFSFIEMNDYLGKLSSSLVESFGPPGQEIEVVVETNHLSVDVDTAIPLGLIANELLTNSFKHAFVKTEHPYLWIRLHIDTGLLVLEVGDNGMGPPSDFEAKSFGLRLVRELTAQLEGTITFTHVKGLVALLKVRKFKIQSQ